MAQDLLQALPLGGDSLSVSILEKRQGSDQLAKRKPGKSRFFLQVLYLAFGGFILSYSMNLSLESISEKIPLLFSLPLFLSVVVLGAISDAVGLASARAKEESLLAMASRRVTGAREAVWFVRNASRVSSVFSDLMGDVAATLSGALAVAMALRMRGRFPDVGWAYLASGAVGVASFLSVGGKALFKPVALKYAETIILLLGKMRRLWLVALRGKSTRR